MFISEQTNVNLGNDECIWVLDSGLSLHLTPGKSKFPNYTVGDYGHVKMGNDGACKIVGIGNVWLLISISCGMLLKDVCHVPDIRLDLISVGRQ